MHMTVLCPRCKEQVLVRIRISGVEDGLNVLKVLLNDVVVPHTCPDKE